MARYLIRIEDVDQALNLAPTSEFESIQQEN
jgi:hypothetical protein